MFTGIIESTAPMLAKSDTSLRVARPSAFDDLHIGGSIAVAGACLTVTSFDNQSMTFDVVPETWAATTLGSLEQGSLVNLERAMRADARFGGHVVQGHVEGTAEVVSLGAEGEGMRLRLRVPPALAPFLIAKGSVTLDGVSLTLAAVRTGECEVAIVPSTLRHTTLGSLITGNRVNVETDLFVRAVLASRNAYDKK